MNNSIMIPVVVAAFLMLSAPPDSTETQTDYRRLTLFEQVARMRCQQTVARCGSLDLASDITANLAPGDAFNEFCNSSVAFLLFDWSAESIDALTLSEPNLTVVGDWFASTWSDSAPSVLSNSQSYRN